MIVIISPSKTMKIESLDKYPNKAKSHSEIEDNLIRETLRTLSEADAKLLYKASDKVVQEAMRHNHDERRARAIDLYEGLVYKNINYEELGRNKTYIHKHLYILSPVDSINKSTELISPYRLDLSQKNLGPIESVVGYHKPMVTQVLKACDEEIIIDLASKEYQQLLDVEALRATKQVIQIDFKTLVDGKLKTVATHSKMARGQFIREMALQNVKTIKALKTISVMGYVFSQEHSSQHKWLFVKDNKAKKDSL